MFEVKNPYYDYGMQTKGPPFTTCFSETDLCKAWEECHNATLKAIKKDRPAFTVSMEAHKAGDLEALLVPWAWDLVADTEEGDGVFAFFTRPEWEELRKAAEG